MPQTKDRKLDHINIVNEKNVEPFPSAFDDFRLPYRALPEVNFADITTATEFLGYNLSFPFIISSMTGGLQKGAIINKNLALAAEEIGVPLGLGSMRVILRKPESKESFDVKKYCPSVPLLANFGAIQLNYGYTAADINKIIDSINADGIFLHINPLQEIIQPEGDTNWQGLLARLAEEIPKIEKPVIIKEVGHGIDPTTAQNLNEIGVDWIDVAGLGGTSWSGVEAYRREDNMGHIFKDQGITTTEALQGARNIENLNLIAGGGIRNGLHIAKAIALGASLATAAKPLLNPALESAEASTKVLRNLQTELKISMFSAGVSTLDELQAIELQKAY